MFDIKIFAFLKCIYLFFFMFAPSSAGSKFRNFTSSWKRGGMSVCRNIEEYEIPYFNAMFQLYNPLSHFVFHRCSSCALNLKWLFLATKQRETN